jgi:hypothetical protein
MRCVNSLSISGIVLVRRGTLLPPAGMLFDTIKGVPVAKLLMTDIVIMAFYKVV